MADQQNGGAAAAKEKKAKYIALVEVNLGKDENGREKTVPAGKVFEIEESRGVRICKTMMGSTPAAVPATKENLKKYRADTDEEE